MDMFSSRPHPFLYPHSTPSCLQRKSQFILHIILYIFRHSEKSKIYEHLSWRWPDYCNILHHIHEFCYSLLFLFACADFSRIYTQCSSTMMRHWHCQTDQSVPAIIHYNTWNRHCSNFGERRLLCVTMLFKFCFKSKSDLQYFFLHTFMHCY
jgi:hypothetical protein